MSSSTFVFRCFSCEVVSHCESLSLTKSIFLFFWKGHFDSSVWTLKWLQMEKSWIPSLLSSSGSTFVVSASFSFDKVWTTRILNFQISIPLNRFLEPYMVSNRKVMNTKFSKLLKIYIFYFGHFFIWESFQKI